MTKDTYKKYLDEVSKMYKPEDFNLPSIDMIIVSFDSDSSYTRWVECDRDIGIVYDLVRTLYTAGDNPKLYKMALAILRSLDFSVKARKDINPHMEYTVTFDLVFNTIHLDANVASTKGSHSFSGFLVNNPVSYIGDMTGDEYKTIKTMFNSSSIDDVRLGIRMAAAKGISYEQIQRQIPAHLRFYEF